MVLMRPVWTNGAAARFCRAVACAALALVGTGCSLIKAGCGNRDVRSHIEQEARESVDLWLTSKLGKQPLPADTRYVLSGTYEIARDDNTRSCSGTVKVGDAKSEVAVPIEYEVITTDDGQVMYRWDNTTFGKSLIEAALVSGISKATSTPEQAPAPNDRGEPNNEDRPQADIGAEKEQWRNEVIDAVNAQATNFQIVGSGSVGIAFDVSATGDISRVTVFEGSGNAGLDSIAVQMAERVEQVRPPPDQQPTRISMKLSFL